MPARYVLPGLFSAVHHPSIDSWKQASSKPMRSASARKSRRWSAPLPSGDGWCDIAGSNARYDFTNSSVRKNVWQAKQSSA